jgi:cbb3-type cytochrome oxidase subunit 3
MTFMHDDVWLPFLLSMATVLFIVIMIYVPDDTGQYRPSYIPKRHRKWSRYRVKVVKIIASRLGSTSTWKWIAGQSRKIENAILTTRTTKRHRGQKRGQDALLHQVNKGVRKAVRDATNTLAYRAMKDILKAAYRMVKAFWRTMLCTDQDSPSSADIMKRSIIPLLLSRSTETGQRVCIIAFSLFLLACTFHVYGKEMQGKMQQIKQIINDTTAFRATLRRGWILLSPHPRPLRSLSTKHSSAPQPSCT